MAMDDENAKAWQLRRVGTDGSEIGLVAEADTRDELRRLHKRRRDWRYKVYYPGVRAPSKAMIEKDEPDGPSL